MNKAKFSGHQFEIPHELNDQTNYAVQFEASLVETRRKNNEDGTYTNIHVLRPIIVQIKALEGQAYQEPTITTTSKKSLSKQLRDTLWVYWNQQLSQKYPDFENYYRAYMDKQINKVKEMVL